MNFVEWSAETDVPTPTDYQDVVSTNEVFQVARAGSYTFYGMAVSMAKDEAHAYRPALVLMYFPTAYGEVASTLAEGVGGNTPASQPDVRERDLDLNSQAWQPSNGFDLLQSEVRALKMELRALRDEINSRER